jgi:UPF0716 protein FxsA
MTSYVVGFFTLGVMAEIYSLQLLSSYISFLNTISLLMFVFLSGIFLGRSFGDECFEKLQWHLRSRTLPADDTMDGALMAITSMLLITPGVITDILALLILIPPSRKLFKASVLSLVKSRIAEGKPYFFFKD